MGLCFIAAITLLSLLLRESIFHATGPAPVPGPSFVLSLSSLTLAILLLPMLWKYSEPTMISTLTWSTLTTAATLLLNIGGGTEGLFKVGVPLATGVFMTTLLLGTLTIFLSRRCNLDAATAHRTVLSLFGIVVAAPLWLAPLAEEIGSQRFTNLVLAISPAGYLAALIDYDLLRSAWFYTNTPWGGMRYDYPDPLTQTLIYAGMAIVLGLAANRAAGHVRGTATHSFNPTCKETMQ